MGLEAQEIEQLAEKVGGRVKLTAMVQKRLRELAKGAPPLVPVESRNLVDVAIEEVKAGKVFLRNDEMKEFLRETKEEE